MSATRHQSGKPRSRQRAYKAPPQLDVPEIEDDAAERKRVLNVLAQRRYREKKRQRRLQQRPHEEHDDEAVEIMETDALQEDSGPVGCDSEPLDFGGINDIDNGWPGSLNMSMTPLLLDPDMEPNLAQTNSDWVSSSLSFAKIENSLSELFPSSNTGSPASFGTSPRSANSDGLSDSYLLPIYELSLLKGMMRIAERLGSPDDVWSLTSQSPFPRGGGTPADELPPTWQPTATQVLMPHHPFLDFLPWPSVRDKAIQIFSLPERSRPPSAAGPLGLANLAYDIEDSSGGVRIYGEDPYDPAYWEVGQIFFQRWWFLFDRDIIATSNRWRRLRGAPPLAIKAAGEEGA